MECFVVRDVFCYSNHGSFPLLPLIHYSPIEMHPPRTCVSTVLLDLSNVISDTDGSCVCTSWLWQRCRTKKILCIVIIPDTFHSDKAYNIHNIILVIFEIYFTSELSLCQQMYHVLDSKANSYRLDAGMYIACSTFNCMQTLSSTVGFMTWLTVSFFPQHPSKLLLY